MNLIPPKRPEDLSLPWCIDNLPNLRDYLTRARALANMNALVTNAGVTLRYPVKFGEVNALIDFERAEIEAGIPTDGLEGWWQLQDGTGISAIDSSGNGLTATLLASGGPVPTWSTGHLGTDGAVQFSNAHWNWVETPSITTSGNTTMAGWMSCTWAGVANQVPTIFAQGFGGAIGPKLFSAGFTLGDWLIGDVVGCGDGYNSGRAPRVIGIPGSLTANSWHHLAAVLGTTQSKIYLDGVLVASTRVSTTGTIPSLTAAASMGCQPFQLDVGNCKVSQVMLYSRELSASEVGRIYANT